MIGISTDLKKNLLQEAIALIPAPCRDILYREAFLTWAETGSSAATAQEMLVLYVETASSAQRLYQAHEAFHCFSFLSNMALLACHVPHFAICSRSGIVRGGFYVSPPNLEPQIVSSYVALFAGDLQAVYEFNHTMLTAFLEAILQPEAAHHALRLIALARDCHTKQEQVLSRISELGSPFDDPPVIVLDRS